MSHIKSVFNKQATLVSELEFAILNYTNSQTFIPKQNGNTSSTFQIEINSKSFGNVFLTYGMFRDPKVLLSRLSVQAKLERQILIINMIIK